MSCAKCKQDAQHSLQIRNGDPTREPDSRKPDRSRLQIVQLCQDHWEELRLFLGVGLA